MRSREDGWRQGPGTASGAGLQTDPNPAHVCVDDSTAAVSLVLPRTWLCARVPHTLPLFLFLTIKRKAMHGDLHLADKETEAKIRYIISHHRASKGQKCNVCMIRR